MWRLISAVWSARLPKSFNWRSSELVFALFPLLSFLDHWKDIAHCLGSPVLALLH